MPVNKLTQQEVQAWLGNGIVTPGPRQQQASTEQSLPLSEAAQNALELGEQILGVSSDNLERQAFDDYEQAISQLASDTAPQSMEQPASEASTTAEAPAQPLQAPSTEQG